MSSPIFTAATLTDDPNTTLDAAYWYDTVVKPTSDAVGEILGDSPNWTTLLPGQLGGGWVPYSPPTGGSWSQPSYRTFGTRVEFQGLVKLGGLGVGNPILTMPPALCPTTTVIMNAVSDSGFAKIELDPTGLLFVSLYIGGGSNSYVALDALVYFAE